MEEKGIVPIVEKLLQPNYLFALEFSEGFVFGRVVRRRICQWKPYQVINSAGTVVSISASSHQSELRFRDPRNTANEILYLDTTTNSGYAWIFHGSFGIKPDYVRMYLRFPSGETIPGRFPNVDPIRPSSGDDFGYIDSRKSPYEQPTDYVEIVIPPLTSIGAEYYNNDPDKAHTPVLNILFALYWFQPLTKQKHAPLIGKIARREVPSAFLTVGFGDTPIELGDRLKKDWGVEPLSLDEASQLGGGGR